MNLKIAFPVIAGLGLTLFAFKPVPNSNITRLENGNYHLNGVNMSESDIAELNDLARGKFIFHHNVKKDKDASIVTDDLVSTQSTTPTTEEVAKVNSILSRYE